MLSLIQKLKEEAEKLEQEFGYCILDGHREKIGNFKMEPPGLFCGRGDHPKMGMLKRRIRPEDVIINCSRCVEQVARLSWECELGMGWVHAGLWPPGKLIFVLQVFWDKDMSCDMQLATPHTTPMYCCGPATGVVGSAVLHYETSLCFVRLSFFPARKFLTHF